MSKRRKPASTTAIAYCRVSALESQRASSEDNSLDAQERTLTARALADGYADVLVIRERHTASKRRPELEHALTLLESGQAAALYATKVDRLSRKGAADVLRIADRAEREGWRFVVLDVALDTGTAVGQLVLSVMACVARMESERRQERMREYHEERRARGEQSGRDYGRRTTASAATIERILDGRAAGQTWQAITDALNASGADGRTWHPTAVRRIYGSPSVSDIAA